MPSWHQNRPLVKGIETTSPAGQGFCEQSCLRQGARSSPCCVVV